MNNSRLSDDALGKSSLISDSHFMDVSSHHSSKLDPLWLGRSGPEVYPVASRWILFCVS
jgi:hypothetical protein